MSEVRPKPHQVATWRFELISPFLDPTLDRAARRRAMRERVAVVGPDGRRQRVPRTTLFRWIRAFRAHGYEGLLPKERSDKGKTRSDTKTFVHYAIGLLLEQPQRSLVQLGVYLRAQFPGYALPPATLARHLHQHPAFAAVLALRGKGPRKLYGRYEASRPHESWQLDGKGPFAVHLKSGDLIRVHVLSVLDDHSRAILAALAATAEDTKATIAVFQKAATRYGLPDRMQFDRGSAFDSQVFRDGIAQCGVHRNHVHARQPTAQGKIEAYHRSLGRWFLDELKVQEVVDLDHLQQLLDAMLELVYQTHRHRVTGQSPKARLDDKVSARRVSEADLARAFFVTQTAKSHQKTGEVQLHNGRFRVPLAFAGKQARFRYDPVRQVAVLVLADGRELGLEPFMVLPLPTPAVAHGQGQLQKLLDSWRGTERPNAQPAFGLPEVLVTLGELLGRTVPIDASEAHQVLAFWKQHGPLARAPWLSACERTRKALGQGHALSTYLADLARQVAEVKP